VPRLLTAARARPPAPRISPDRIRVSSIQGPLPQLARQRRVGRPIQLLVGRIGADFNSALNTTLECEERFAAVVARSGPMDWSAQWAVKSGQQASRITQGFGSWR